jgi:hypothetical protein
MEQLASVTAATEPGTVDRKCDAAVVEIPSECLLESGRELEKER